MVGNWDREERRDKKEEDEKGQPRSRLQVVETLIGGLNPSQCLEGGKSGKVTYETSEEHKNGSVEWGHTCP